MRQRSPDDPGRIAEDAVRHADDSAVDWAQWVRRSIAEAYATGHGFEFFPDE
jgi:hypothetical protein